MAGLSASAQAAPVPFRFATGESRRIEREAYAAAGELDAPTKQIGVGVTL
ncbi:hypothetical protein [Mycobacterium heckeshornense]|nr:hypothetical protein [Mycobacterium heckeshornense]MCV7035040.1 hypothetical protein [Mycobacterium heckeshornense]